MWDDVFLPCSFILNASQICPILFVLGFVLSLLCLTCLGLFGLSFFFDCFFLPITCTIALSLMSANFTILFICPFLICSF